MPPRELSKLGDEDGATVKSPTEVGTGRTEDDEAPLSEIIAKLNDRFGTAFTETDRLFMEQLQQDGANDEDISQTVLANTFEKFDLAVRQLLPKLMIDRMAGNDRASQPVLQQPRLPRDRLHRASQRHLRDCQRPAGTEALTNHCYPGEEPPPARRRSLQRSPSWGFPHHRSALSACSRRIRMGSAPQACPRMSLPRGVLGDVG